MTEYEVIENWNKCQVLSSRKKWNSDELKNETCALIRKSQNNVSPVLNGLKCTSFHCRRAYELRELASSSHSHTIPYIDVTLVFNNFIHYFYFSIQYCFTRFVSISNKYSLLENKVIMMNRIIEINILDRKLFFQLIKFKVKQEKCL